MANIRDVREDEIEEVDTRNEIPRTWHLSADARSAIQRGDGLDEKNVRIDESEAAGKGNDVLVRDSGKVLTDDREPGVATHVHRHEGGVTISVKDQNEGKVERYNFDTGEGFEKTVTEMSPNESQNRMRSEHTDYNPNPDHDTISGFHSSVWSKPSDVEEED